jgi:hypothetical protein
VILFLLVVLERSAIGIVSIDSVAQGEDSAVTRFLAPWRLDFHDLLAVTSETSCHNRYTKLVSFAEMDCFSCRHPKKVSSVDDDG